MNVKTVAAALLISLSMVLTGGFMYATASAVEDGDAAEKTSFTINGKTSNVTIRDLAVEVLRFLSVGVGIAVVGGVIAGGIVYSTSEGNPAKAQKGVTIISNAILGLILYLLMFAILHFLIPGGVIS